MYIQSFEVSNLRNLSRRTNIKLVHLVDADDVNADGSVSLSPSLPPALVVRFIKLFTT
jgi:glycerophosphoryl diester phosphodiesterase